MLGILLAECRAFDEAFALADKGVTLAPESAAAHVARGEVFLYADRGDEGLASFERALALDSKNARAHGGRGSALSQLGRHHEAVTALRRALEIDHQSLEQFPQMKLYYQNSLSAIHPEGGEAGAPRDS
jgi:tetratricopeptide (TPR) repeat protein